MKLGIMQPYFFPYIGYFQLINIVDAFVICDDCQWIKGGWINRNRILVQGESHYITLPIQQASSTLKINQRQLSSDIEKEKEKIIQTIERTYRKAPYFDPAMGVIRECFAYSESNVSRFVVNSLRVCCDYLGIQTPFFLSSELDGRKEFQRENMVLDINSLMGATHYINPIGGTKLYHGDRFAEKGLQLSFLEARKVAYNQLGNNEFVPFLSIIDIMMFNSQYEIAELLKEYDLHYATNNMLDLIK